MAELSALKILALPRVNDYFLGKCSLVIGEDQFLGRSAHFLGGKLSLFGLSDA